MIDDPLVCQLGETKYRFREVGCFDLPLLHYTLGRIGVRRPTQFELRLQGLDGIVELGKKVGDEAEGKRQRALLEDWYRLSDPIREDDIDIVDYQERAAEMGRLEGERVKDQLAIWPEVSAIEANLERHWPPYHELLADLKLWDRISAIEVVRLMLVSIEDAGGDLRVLSRDDRGMLRQADYQSLPREHRLPLATFAFKLLSPDTVTEKN